MRNRGQGSIGAWITGLVGMAVVVSIFILMNQVIWDENGMGLAGIANQTMGLDLNAEPIPTLRTSWQLWPVAMIIGWALYMIIYSMIREPYRGLR
jgi:hypothetical protein